MLRRLFAKREDPLPAVLYGRADCHLCDEMLAAIDGSPAARQLVIEHVDIGGDPVLEENYGRSIPVLEIAGRVAFKGRLDGEALVRKVARFRAELAGERGDPCR